MILPTIGRDVLFVPDATAADNAQPLTAKITYVHSASLINIGGFDASGLPYARTSVMLIQEEDATPATGFYAHWMPFQITAAKAAAAPVPTGFAFALGEEVELALSGEEGIVIGRAEYTDEAPSFYVRYVDSDGKQVTGWMSASAITHRT
jgi:hypothetical protein